MQAAKRSSCLKNQHLPYKNKRITIMGLGLHGGGLASALFFIKQQARVTITDLKDAQALAPSLEKLKDLPVRLVLGRHEENDFINTDLIIKNPGVPQHNRFLMLARKHHVPIESDLAIFLRACPSPILAVTGSKGKSTTASAIWSALLAKYPNTRLGGNITISPLSFLEELSPSDPVVLELSSWQLHDLKDTGLLKPRISLITCIRPDHQNHYSSLKDYIADKKLIYAHQTGDDFSIFNFDDPETQEFLSESQAHQLVFSRRPLPSGINGGWLEKGKGVIRFNGREIEILKKPLQVVGEHNRLNLLSAALALSAFGLPLEIIEERLTEFKGIEHRLENFLTYAGVTFINDSAATIPHATAEAIASFISPLILICGGTDKKLDFSPLKNNLKKLKAIILLEGSATKKILEILRTEEVNFSGPYDCLETAVRKALALASSGDTVLFSPGCASFELFANEFDRGKKFKDLVFRLAKEVLAGN